MTLHVIYAGFIWVSHPCRLLHMQVPFTAPPLVPFHGRSRWTGQKLRAKATSPDQKAAGILHKQRRRRLRNQDVNMYEHARRGALGRPGAYYSCCDSVFCAAARRPHA